MTRNYQRRILAGNEDVGSPAPLPADLVGLPDEVLSDLSAHLDPRAAVELGYRGHGFFPVEETPPPPPRRLISKSVIHERVNAVGKLDEAFAALNASPILFGRWFAPNWPNVYFDDPSMLTLLQSIGCTPEEIATITAA